MEISALHEPWYLSNMRSPDAIGGDKWMKEEDMCQMMLYNGEPLSVKPPNFAELRIIETDPGVRGDTSGGGAPATLGGQCSGSAFCR
jgi:hypothetical protein